MPPSVPPTERRSHYQARRHGKPIRRSSFRLSSRLPLSASNPRGARAVLPRHWLFTSSVLERRKFACHTRRAGGILGHRKRVRPVMEQEVIRGIYFHVSAIIELSADFPHSSFRIILENLFCCSRIEPSATTHIFMRTECNSYQLRALPRNQGVRPPPSRLYRRSGAQRSRTAHIMLLRQFVIAEAVVAVCVQLRTCCFHSVKALPLPLSVWLWPKPA